MQKKILFVIFIFNFFSSTFMNAMVSLAPVYKSAIYKTNIYYVACCPQNCCPSCCYCECESCENKPFCEWDESKHRCGCCLYSVKKESGRLNQKRGYSVSFEGPHVGCVNNGASIRNCIGRNYDKSRKCNCSGRNTAGCDLLGCCIRKIERLVAPASCEPMN